MVKLSQLWSEGDITAEEIRVEGWRKTRITLGRSEDEGGKSRAEECGQPLEPRKGQGTGSP